LYLSAGKTRTVGRRTRLRHALAGFFIKAMFEAPRAVAAALS